MKKTIEEQIIFNKLTGMLPLKNDRSGETVAKETVNIIQADPAAVDIGAKQNAYIGEVIQRINVMQTTRQNFACRPLYSHRRYIGKIIVFLKRVVRKLLKWLIEPICIQQTEFNNAVTPAIGRLTELQQYSLTHIAQLESELPKEISALQADAASWKAEADEAKKQILKLENANQTVLLKNTELEERFGASITKLEERHQHNEERSAQKLAEVTNQFEAVAATLEEKQRETDEKYEEKLEAATTRFELLLTKFEARNREAEAAHIAKFTEMENNYSNRLKSLETYVSEMESHLRFARKELDRAKETLEKAQIEGAIPENGGYSTMFRKSMSQSGEDSILAHILLALGKDASQCSYLDLGANHAMELSNTCYFYNKGARGVLVEANPALIGELKFYRNGDVILNRCVSDKSGETIDFYVLNGDGLSTPDKAQAEEAIARNPALHIERTVSVETITVNEIMDTYFDGAPMFMNVDLEGDDMRILESIDFEAHRPLAISIEMIPYRNHLVVGMKDQDILDFMEKQDYTEYAFTGINSIFLDKRQIKEVLE